MKTTKKSQKMAKKILIVDRVHPSLVANLEKNGYCCTINQTLSYQDFVALSDDFVGLIIRSRFRLDAAAIDSKKMLKFVVRIGSGVENIDVDFCKKMGVACLSTPEGNANAVAEHALGLLLAALKNIATAHTEVCNGIWEREKNKGHEIGAKTIGIIGYGHTGRAFAQILHHFGCKIFAYDKFKCNFQDDFVEETTLENLLATCDVISLHINYLPENQHFINEDVISKCQKQPIFINTSRGMSVDTAALVEALQNGKISYACLDVLEFENVRLKNAPPAEWTPAMQTLATLKNALLTPHIAGQTFEAEQKHADIALQKILNVTI